MKWLICVFLLGFLLHFVQARPSQSLVYEGIVASEWRSEPIKKGPEPKPKQERVAGVLMLLWGTWHLTGFLAFFAFLGPLTILGLAFWIFALMVFGLFMAGLSFLLEGIALIDESYLLQSPNPTLQWLRKRKHFRRRFLGAFGLMMAMLPTFLLIGSWVLLLVFFALFLLVFLRIAAAKRRYKRAIPAMPNE